MIRLSKLGQQISVIWIIAHCYCGLRRSAHLRIGNSMLSNFLTRLALGYIPATVRHASAVRRRRRRRRRRRWRRGDIIEFGAQNAGAGLELMVVLVTGVDGLRLIRDAMAGHRGAAAANATGLSMGCPNGRDTNTDGHWSANSRRQRLAEVATRRIDAIKQTRTGPLLAPTGYCVTGGRAGGTRLVTVV